MSRRGFALRPVDSEKKEITWSNLLQDASTTQVIVLAEGTVPSATNAATEVTIGSTIKWIYFEFHFSPAQTGNANVIHWKVSKLPFGTVATVPSTYNQVDKRFILKRGMEMLPTNVSTVFKRIFVVKIPKRIARIGSADKIVFEYVASSTQQINACGIAIYKAFK